VISIFEQKNGQFGQASRLYLFAATTVASKTIRE